MTPYQVWKTLRLHGPSSAREVISYWAVVPLSEVRPGAIPPVLDALVLLDERQLIEPTDPAVEYVNDDTFWRALDPADDDEVRAANWKRLAADWRRSRRGDAIGEAERQKDARRKSGRGPRAVTVSPEQ